jgi:membrane associated rhomboid family serine protease
MTMSNQPLPPAQPGRRRPARRSWDLGTDDAATVLAEARRALFVMVGILAILWIIQIVNWADHYALTFNYGIRPRDVGSLPDIITAPFLHFSWAHIEGNSGPLFIFGFLAAYRGVRKFAAVSVLVIVVSGLAAWFTASAGSVGAGASGVVFGYFGYIMVRGFFDRHPIDMLLGAVMALCFAYQFTVLLPHAGIGWQAHVGGLVGGILAGWLLRERRATKGRAENSGTVGSGSVGSGSVGSGSVGSGSTRSGATGSSLTRASGPGAAPGAGGPSGAAGSGDYTGPRGDLHRQLDDLGL